MTQEENVIQQIIQKGKRAGPRRVMVYGTHGIGKSTFAASAPGVVFISTEDGIADIDCDSFPLCKSLMQFCNYLETLLNEQHEYKTVAIDSLDWLERLIWQNICEKHKVKTILDVGFGKGYAEALTGWVWILNKINELKETRGMGVILLAHANVKEFKDPERESYDRYSPKLHDKASEAVQEWCDEVLFASYKVFVKTEEKGFTQKTRGVGTGERILRTTERPFCVAKNRLAGLPEEIPLSWDSYAQHLN